MDNKDNTKIKCDPKKRDIIAILRDFHEVSPNAIRNILDTICECYNISVPEESFLIHELKKIGAAICPRESDGTLL